MVAGKAEGTGEAPGNVSDPLRVAAGPGVLRVDDVGEGGSNSSDVGLARQCDRLVGVRGEDLLLEGRRIELIEETAGAELEQVRAEFGVVPGSTARTNDLLRHGWPADA